MTDRRTSKLAVTALILGFLGFFGSAGIGAIALGIVAWLRIRRSGGQLVGARMALTALVCPIVIAGAMFVVYAVGETRPLPPRLLCGSHLVTLGKAMLLYANDHDGRLPTPSQWCDILLKTGQIKPTDLQCPGVREPPATSPYPLERYLYTRWKHARSVQGLGACDYAINVYSEEKGTAGEPGTILLFETNPGWNQVGGPEAMAMKHHDVQGCNAFFLDGYVSFVKPEDVGELRWKP
jgi:hypothetical protein